MLKKIAATVSAIFLLGASELPSPSGGEAQGQHETNSAEHHSNTAPAQRGTPDAPFIVQIQQPQNQNPVAAKPKNKGHWYAHPDWWVAGFTGALFLATTGLWVFTALLWLMVRKEFNAAHRPKIRIKHLWLTGEIWEGQKIRVELVFVNSGTAEAIIEQGILRAILVDASEDLPPRPPFVPQDAFRIGNPRLPVGQTLSIQLNDAAGLVLTDADNFSLREKQKTLYCIGAIDYLDRKGGRRKTAFCREFRLPTKPSVNLRAGRFVKREDPNYEYED